MSSDQTVQLDVYNSPKRKRDAAGSASYTTSSLPLPPSLNTDLPVHSRSADEEVLPGNGSPRTAVAGRFQNLHIQSTSFKLDLGERYEGEAVQKKSRLMDDLSNSGDARTVHGSLMPGQQGAKEAGERSKPVAIDEIQENATSRKHVLPYPSPEATRDSSPSPRSSFKQSGHGEDQPSTTRSPPPTESLTWQDSEITGHAPTDPLDDGYGINGIGFRPTPAVAYARAQKRTQQVQDWRTREAREARQRRSERRRGINHGPPEGADCGVSEQRRRVRFYED